ncbi:MAG: acetyl-CoA carboxylase, biotin carboxyl carrier protein [Spirochaetes bacterium GWB1_48_6]|nr:MAG: acetyl-CoA carboxylase, biotin carboxyl carrier protein [Spirochaetes bacterium GWB1_48_6]
METKDILTIVEKFDHSGLAEFKYKDGSVELFLKRQSEVVAYAPAPVHQVAHAAGPAPAASAAPSAGKAGTEVVVAPIVGTFYRSAAPDAPVFSEEGKFIKKGETLAIIEAMKVMNELEAEFDCEIVKILVDNGKMVEYGTPLFEVIRK